LREKGRETEPRSYKESWGSKDSGKKSIVLQGKIRRRHERSQRFSGRILINKFNQNIFFPFVL